MWPSYETGAPTLPQVGSPSGPDTDVSAEAAAFSKDLARVLRFRERVGLFDARKPTACTLAGQAIRHLPRIPNAVRLGLGSRAGLQRSRWLSTKAQMIDVDPTIVRPA